MRTMSSGDRTTIIGETQVQPERLQSARLIWAAPLTALTAAIFTVGVREVGVAIGTIPGDLQILQEPMVATSTVAFVLLGALVFALIARFSKHPVRTFRRVATAALILTFVNPIAASAGWIPIGVRVGVATVGSMLVMHIVAAAVTVYLLPRLIRER